MGQNLRHFSRHYQKICRLSQEETKKPTERKGKIAKANANVMVDDDLKGSVYQN